MNDCSYIEWDFQKRKEKTMRNISEKQSIEEVEVCEGNHQHQLEYLKNRMPTQQEMETAAELFKMFGDPTRLKLLAALLGQEVCVCDLSDLLGISQSAVSHQLRLLRASHLVKNRREGKSVFYSLDDEHVATILAQGMEHVRHQ